MMNKGILTAADQPILGSFYIVDGEIYYNEKGLTHDKFWKKLVLKLFPTLEYETKMELANAPYGVDRGRVDWFGEFDSEGNPLGKGHYSLIGTAGCAAHEANLKKALHLSNLSKRNLFVDFTQSDGHYKTLKSDEDLYKLALKFDKPKHLENKHLTASLKDLIRSLIRSR